MKLPLAVILVLISLIQPTLGADDYRLEPLDTPPPSDGVSPAIYELISPTGFKVIRGKSRVVCEVWPARQWTAQADFEASNSILYPLEFGELIGLARWPRKGSDFRDQEIASGVYTMRYALQPVDGNHIGTSDTRDFILLSRAEDDTDPQPVDKAALFKRSAGASGTTHPAMLSLLAAGESEGATPVLVHNEQRELWSVKFTNPVAQGDKVSDLTLELVVVGKAAE